MTPTAIVLKSMGYRRMEPRKSPNTWGKPIGNVLFTVELQAGAAIWTNWFKDIQGQMRIYDAKTLKQDERLLVNLKQAETYTRIDLCGERASAFEFCNLIEELELESEL
jgi:hypothetical protein